MDIREVDPADTETLRRHWELTGSTAVAVGEHAPGSGWRAAHSSRRSTAVTGNADVNDALGYREVERCIEMQRAQ